MCCRDVFCVVMDITYVAAEGLGEDEEDGEIDEPEPAVDGEGEEEEEETGPISRALALQLQMLQRMGAQVEAAAAAALEDARTKPKRGSAPHRPSYTQGTMVSDARVQMRH